MNIPGIAVNHLPENGLIAEFPDVCDRVIAFDIQPGHQNCTNHTGSRIGACPYEDGQNIDMQLTNIRIIALEASQLRDAFFVLKELGIRFHCFPHLGRI